MVSWYYFYHKSTWIQPLPVSPQFPGEKFLLWNLQNESPRTWQVYLCSHWEHIAHQSPQLSLESQDEQFYKRLVDKCVCSTLLVHHQKTRTRWWSCQYARMKLLYPSESLSEKEQTVSNGSPPSLSTSHSATAGWGRSATQPSHTGGTSGCSSPNKRGSGLGCGHNFLKCDYRITMRMYYD